VNFAIDTLWAVSKLGFWFKIKEDSSFQPQEYWRISRTGNEDPTPRWGEKTILRWLLVKKRAVRPNKGSDFANPKDSEA